ncbi:MAG: AAA family ATPase [Glaciimonas sp.]|nr:AAA family ATPase [Glaciimonas sp.]
MYISKIHINNFRNFTSQDILFNNGINVVIGHNNAGKTNLIKALQLVIDVEAKKRLTVDDFNKHISFLQLRTAPPRISIEVTISRGADEEDDLAMVGEWLTKLEPSYEAKLTFEFYLPESDIGEYVEMVSSISETDTRNKEKVWKILQHDFIRRYKHRIFGGLAANQALADNELLRKFDFQFLDAIRDVERDMHNGRAALLRDVLDFFMDYEIKSMPLAEKSKKEKDEEIRLRRVDFAADADILIDKLQIRMKTGKGHILSYAKETGASFEGAIPNFEADISDVEMFSALKLIIEHTTGIKIPATHNGLGYNNLIYMSLLLAKMQMNSDMDYMGGNSKVFAMLAIEEPEAHLHPAMQYKFLKFLKANRTEKKVRQIFLTTHSAHITSAVSLDEIICLGSVNGVTTVGYPGRVFPNDASKMYVQRFLDATKSEMLFAKSIILVEGIAEQLLMSQFAQYEGKSLEDGHIAVVNVGGRYFEHFLHLFDNSKANTIHKTVACVTDRDPERKRIDGKDSFRKCYPFEYQADVDVYEYRCNEVTVYDPNSNIKYFTQDNLKGKTFEYELVLCNPALELLLTASIANSKEIVEIMKLLSTAKSSKELLAKLRKGPENDRISEGIAGALTWDESDKNVAIIASRYLNSVGKGANALELAHVLQTNFDLKGTPEYAQFTIPPYLTQAISWVCP